MEQTIETNPIPYLTWTWLKLNSDKVTYDFSINQNDGEVTQLPEGVDMVKPGDNVKVFGELIHPVAMDKGLKFAIREGGRTIASGQVTDIVE